VIHSISHLLSPLALTPLVWIVVTLWAYLAAQRLQQLLRGSAMANPVLVTIVVVASVLLASHTSYATYFEGARFINFLLGPATVALAAPLARNIRHVGRSVHAVGLALVAGSLVSMLGGMGLVWALGGTRTVALSMAPKAVTTPIAIGVSHQIGGLPPLTAALAILGGIFAAVVGQRLLTALRIDDHRAHGFAAGMAGSGIAAAQAARLGGLAAAFAGLGIALNGLATAIIAPLLAALIR
jgi:putative effector of murein hydrolase